MGPPIPRVPGLIEGSPLVVKVEVKVVVEVAQPILHKNWFPSVVVTPTSVSDLVLIPSVSIGDP